MSLIIAIAKVLGISLSGFFGVIGTIHDFKDDDGNVTRWGKLAIYGLSFSLLCAIGAQSWESWDAYEENKSNAEKTLEATKRIEKLLVDVDRSLRPIESIGLFVSDLSADSKVPSIYNYLKKIKEVTNPLYIKDKNGKYPNTDDAYNYWRSQGIQVISKGEFAYQMMLKGPLSPEEFLPNTAGLAVYFARVQIFDSSRGDEAISKHLSYEAGDISLNLNSPQGDEVHAASLFSSALSTHYKVGGIATPTPNQNSGKIILTGHLANDDKSSWDSNGTIISVPDLRGAWVRISFSPYGQSDNDHFSDVRKSLKLESINFKINSRDAWVREDQIVRYESNSSPYWVFRLGNEDPFLVEEAHNKSIQPTASASAD